MYRPGGPRPVQPGNQRRSRSGRDCPPCRTSNMLPPGPAPSRHAWCIASRHRRTQVRRSGRAMANCPAGRRRERDARQPLDLGRPSRPGKDVFSASAGAGVPERANPSRGRAAEIAPGGRAPRSAIGAARLRGCRSPAEDHSGSARWLRLVPFLGRLGLPSSVVSPRAPTCRSGEGSPVVRSPSIQ